MAFSALRQTASRRRPLSLLSGIPSSSTTATHSRTRSLASMFDLHEPTRQGASIGGRLRLQSAEGIRQASVLAYSVSHQDPSYSFTHFVPPPTPLTPEQVLQQQQQQQQQQEQQQQQQQQTQAQGQEFDEQQRQQKVDEWLQKWQEPQSLLEEQLQLETSQRIRQQQELVHELARHRNAILERQQQKQILKVQAAHEQQEQQQQQQQQQQQNESALQRNQKTVQGQTQALEHDVDSAAAVQDSNDDDHHDSNGICGSNRRVELYRRTVFGYRGPDHDCMSTDEETEVVTSRNPSHKYISRCKVSAEDRVLLAMMDYSPREIETLTVDQAKKIILSAPTKKVCQDLEPSDAIHLSSSPPAAGLEKNVMELTSVADKQEDGTEYSIIADAFPTAPVARSSSPRKSGSYAS